MKRNVFELYDILGFSTKKKRALNTIQMDIIIKGNRRETINKSFASHRATN